jgi:VCBS repeat-containing protein
MGPATAAEASAAEYGGADYSSPSDTQELIKFEVWVDTAGLTNGAGEILGYEFNIDWDAADVEGLGLAFIPGDLIGYNPNNIDNSSLTFNSTTGGVAVASSGAIVDTDPNNNLAFNGNIQSEKLVATFYMNPTDAAAQEIILTMTNMLVVTDTGNILPANYSFPEVPNSAPVANDDTASATEDAGSITINVLANDADTEADASVTAASATNGSVTINADGTLNYTANADFSGTDTITYTLSDAEFSDTATVAVDVAAVNDAPVAADDSVIVDEDTTVIIDVLANDTDVDGDTLTVDSASAANGTVVVNADNTLSYTANADFNGVDTLTYSVTDSNGGIDTATYNVTVNAVNDAPATADDTAKVHEDASMTINVLANDSDADGDTLTVTAASAANGTVAINADGSVEYTGNTDFNGTDTITYTVSDGTTESTASVTVDVVAVNDDPVANADTAATDEDTSVTINVAANDTDADGDALGVAQASATNGTVAINADGSLTYTPNADTNGTDTITYVASDGVMNMIFDGGLFEMMDPTGAVIGGADDVTGTIAINMATGSGTGAFSSDQLFYGQPWTAHTVTVQMTGADTMIVDMLFDWGTTSNIEVSVPMSVAFNADGTATFAAIDGDGDGIAGNAMTDGPFAGFTPAFSGTADFTAAPESVSTVTVDVAAVNDAPVSNDDAASADEDATITIDVLANDTDADGDTLTVTAASATSGSVSINADGTLAYQGNANFNGTDTITYTISDGNGEESTSTVTVEVAAVNDAPVANADATTADESKVATIDVLANDTDTEGDALSVSAASAPLGDVVVNADGTLTYTGGANYEGSDTITYTVSDGNGGTSEGSVQVSSGSVVTIDNSGIISSSAAAAELAGYSPTSDVNLVKFDVFVDASVLALYDNITAVSFSLSTTELDFIGSNDAAAVFNDFNTADGAYFTMGFDVFADSTGATLTPEKVKVGTFYADPKTDASEIDITLSNIEVSVYGGATESLADITATLDTNIAVEFDATSNTGENIVEDTATVSGTVQTSDINSNAIAFTGDTVGTYGSFAVDAATGTWVYSLDNTKTSVQALKVDEVVTENFTITADDGFGGVDTLGVTVTVTGTNDAPIASADSASLIEDSSVIIDILGNDTDIDGAGETLTITAASASDGTVTINADGTLTYTGDLNFNGADTINYTVADVNGAESSSTVAIDVAAINDAPVAANDFTSSREETAVVINVLANDNDLDGDTLAITNANAANGTVVINGDGTVTYTPDLDFIGSDTVFYTITDGEFSDSAIALVNVSGTNDTPIANADTATAAEETSTTITVLDNDTDVDGDSLAVAQASATNGTVTINTDGTLEYTANQDFNGTDTITYTVTDGVMNLAFDGGLFEMLDPNGNVIGGADDVTGTMAINMANGSGTGTISSNQDFYGQAWTAHAVNVQMTGPDTMTVDMLFDWGSTTNIEVVVPMQVAFNADGTATFTAVDGDGDGLAGNAMTGGPFAGFTPVFSGTATIEQAEDATTTVTVEVTAINDAPVSNNDTAATNEDAAVTIDVLSNDTDVDRDLNGLDDVLSVTEASAANGSVTINADGTLEYVGNADFNGVDTITYTITDGEYTSTSSVTVDVARVNDDPTAGNDTATTDEETPITIDVLANDADIDVGDVLTVTSASAPNGTVVINADGTLTYTGNQDFSNATDTITYTISDGVGGSATATVDVFVGIVNDAPVSNDDSATVHEDTAVTINVLGNDSDIDVGDVISVVSATAPNGTVTINADGTLEYTGNQDFNGTDTITYTITDGNGAESTSSVTVEVIAVNDGPVTTADTATTNEDTAVTIDATANDTDADGDAVGIVSASADNGTVSVNADGTLEYQGDQDFNGTDTITYVVSDGTMNMAFDGGSFDMYDTTGARVGGADDVTGTISINQATGTGTGAFSSDQLFFGQAWTAHAVTVQMTGPDTMNVDMLFDWGTNTNIEVTVPMSVAFNADGTATFVAVDTDGDGIPGAPMTDGPFVGFTPAFSGTANFVVADEEISTVTVDVVAVNDTPVSADDTAATGEDYAVTVNVLGNDSDVDGDVLTVTAAAATNGTVAINADGSLTYLGDSNFFGTDTITYTIADSDGAESTSSVTVEVAAINDLAVANDDVAATSEDVSITIDALINDTDVDGDALNISSASANNGTVSINADGTLQYQADANFFGTDTITYTISDGSVSSVTNMEFSGGLFEMVSAAGEILGTNEVSGSLSIDMDTGTGVVAFNDGISFYGSPLDIHGSTITMINADSMRIDMLFDWNGITNIESSVNMQMSINADGSTTFVSLDTDGDGIDGLPMGSGPFEGFTASFSGDAVTVASDVAESSIATVTVDVAAVNDGPVANDDTASVDEDALVTINVLANDTDIDRDISGLDDVITVTSASAANGTVSINADGTLDYQGNLNFFGVDTITYTIIDGKGGSASSTVTVDVASMGDGRYISDVDGNQLTNFTISLFSNGVDTGVVLEVDNGKVYLEDLGNTVSFDTVVVNADAFDFGAAINTDDITALMKHKVGLDVLSGNQLQAADVDNDFDVDGSDGWAMSGVVLNGLDLVNTFDLTNADGSAVTELSAAVDGTGLTLVANGDINQSGNFDDAYIMPDIA